MQAAGEAHKQLDEWLSAQLELYAGQYAHLGAGACTMCKKCTYPDAPCRFPNRMYPCVESHGINVIPLFEALEIPFISGENIVTWVSLLFFA